MILILTSFLKFPGAFNINALYLNDNTKYSLPTVSRLFIQCGSLDVSQLNRPPGHVTGIALSLWFRCWRRNYGII
jgi:hypothetical protein